MSLEPQKAKVQIKILAPVMGYNVGQVVAVDEDLAKSLTAERAGGRFVAVLVGSEVAFDPMKMDLNKISQHELEKMGRKNIVSGVPGGKVSSQALTEAELKAQQKKIAAAEKAAADKELADAKALADSKQKAEDEAKALREAQAAAEAEASGKPAAKEPEADPVYPKPGELDQQADEQKQEAPAPAPQAQASGNRRGRNS